MTAETTTKTPKKRRKPHRRGNGEGTIFQRTNADGSPGLWQASVSLGKGDDGKRKRRTVYGQTKADVMAELDKLKQQKREGTIAEPSKFTVAEYLDYWMRNSAKERCRASTLAGYEDTIRLHVKPHIGTVPLSKLGVSHIEGMYRAMEAAGRSARQRQYVHAILRRALACAIRRRWLTVNPCDLAERPKVPKRERPCWTPEEAAAFLTAAKGDRLYALYVLALTAGLRQGELFALKWGDLDLDAGKLTVQRTLLEIKSKHSIGEPKSAKGRRTISLPAEAVDALRDHKRRLLAERNIGSPFVFCSAEGKTLRKSNVRRRSFASIIGKANEEAVKEAAKTGAEPFLIRKLWFHDMRHANATALLKAVVHPKAVQERLGHSQISMTLGTYSHVIQSVDRDAADKIGAALFSRATPALAVAGG